MLKFRCNRINFDLKFRAKKNLNRNNKTCRKQEVTARLKKMKPDKIIMNKTDNN